MKIHKRDRETRGTRSVGLACAMLVVTCGLGLAQQSPTKAPSTHAPRDSVLATPIYWSELHLRMFKDTVSTVDFDLVTSWIPGENHKGMFRFKLSAAPKRPALGAKLPSNIDYDNPEEVEKFIKRVHRCSIFLRVYDSDGFLLREVPVIFDSGTGSDGRITALFANSAVQMDADEYRKLIGNASSAGSYGISWIDPDAPTN